MLKHENRIKYGELPENSKEKLDKVEEEIFSREEYLQHLVKELKHWTPFSTKNFYTLKGSHEGSVLR